ncbi:sugar porter family MFS transporter [Bifidobacterium breve]|nr:sugar porter family MFS transporter [Bifidobacterium breve]
MLISSIGGMGTFLVFACANLLCFLGVVTFVPETKDKTLEEIADLWKPKDEKRSNAQLEVVRATADPK